MEYIYAALLLHSAKKEINEKNVEGVLKAAGLEPDTARIKALTASLQGINIAEAIATPAVATAPVAAQPVAGDKKEAKKEEKPKEPKVSDEEAAAGLSALFG